MVKKFSTQLVLVCAVAVVPALHAQPALSAGESATPQTSAAGTTVELTSDAPDKHVVVRGDTLWDIAGKFLAQPWRWPQIWQLNREQIRNPHLIYPGDIVYLDRSGGTVRLRLGRAVDSGRTQLAASALRTERLSPQVRAEPVAESAIPTVPARLIEPFLNRPLIVDERGLQSHPRILAAPDARVYLGRGDLVYARGIADEQTTDWHVYRPARPILDPDTRKPLAYEALYIGSARLERGGPIARLRIISANEEIGEGDRLTPAVNERPVNFAPRPPEADVSGKIVSIHRGVRQVGRNGVVALNIGRNDGIEVGHVLSIQTTGRVVPDREAGKRRVEFVQLPNLDVGTLLVFRVFDTISYGLVMTASRAVEIGDAVVRP